MEKICISGPGGQAFTVQIKRKKFQSQRIFQLKQKIKRKSGIPANDQRLTHRQKELQSNKTFRSYGICPGSKIFLQDRRKASNRKARSSPEMTSPDIVYSSNSSLSTSDSDEDCNGSPLGSEISSGNEEDIVLGRGSPSRSQQDNTGQDILQSSKQSIDRSRTEYGNTHLQSTTARFEAQDMEYKDNDLLSRNKQSDYTSFERHIQQLRYPVPRETNPPYYHTERIEHNRSMYYTVIPPQQYSEQDVHSRMPSSNTHLHCMKSTNHSMTPQDSVCGYKYGDTNPFQYTPPISTSSNRQHIDNTRSNCNYPNNTTHSQVEYPTDYGNIHLQSTTARFEAQDMEYKDNDLLSRNKQSDYTSFERHIQQLRYPVPRETNPPYYHTERIEHNRSMYYTVIPPQQYSEQDVHSRMPSSNTHLHCMKSTNHSMTLQDSVYGYKYGDTNPFQYTPPISTSSHRQHIDNTRSNYNYPNNTAHSQGEYPTDYGNTYLQPNVFVPGKIISTHFYTEPPRNMQHDRITPSVASLPLSRGNPLMDQIHLNSGNIPVRGIPNKHDKQGSSSDRKCSIL